MLGRGGLLGVRVRVRKHGGKQRRRAAGVRCQKPWGYNSCKACQHARARRRYARCAVRGVRALFGAAYGADANCLRISSHMGLPRGTARGRPGPAGGSSPSACGGASPCRSPLRMRDTAGCPQPTTSAMAACVAPLSARARTRATSRAPNGARAASPNDTGGTMAWNCACSAACLAAARCWRAALAATFFAAAMTRGCAFPRAKPGPPMPPPRGLRARTQARSAHACPPSRAPARDGGRLVQTCQFSALLRSRQLGASLPKPYRRSIQFVVRCRTEAVQSTVSDERLGADKSKCDMPQFRV